WLNTADENVVDFLKRFTFLPLEDIAALESDHQQNPGARLAQKRLAKLVTSFVHTEEVMQRVAKVSALLFGEGSLNDLNEGEQVMLLENAPTYAVSVGADLVTVLVESGLAVSKREARTFIESGAIELMGQKCTDVDVRLAEGHFTQGLATLKRGKKQLVILRLT
ncbi:MAG: S4 domain-containing protein, partial [Bacteroidota bacterium]